MEQFEIKVSTMTPNFEAGTKAWAFRTPDATVDRTPEETADRTPEAWWQTSWFASMKKRVDKIKAWFGQMAYFDKEPEQDEKTPLLPWTESDSE